MITELDGQLANPLHESRYLNDAPMFNTIWVIRGEAGSLAVPGIGLMAYRRRSTEKAMCSEVNQRTPPP